MNQNFKDIYIGKIIKEKVDERGMSYAEFARHIQCPRTSIYALFNSKTIDVERLLIISKVLDYDFLSEVYGYRECTSTALSGIFLPFKGRHIDFSSCPEEVVELLKREMMT